MLAKQEMTTEKTNQFAQLEEMLKVMEDTAEHHIMLARRIREQAEVFRGLMNMDLPYRQTEPLDAVIDYLGKHPGKQLRLYVRNEVIRMGCAYDSTRKEAGVSLAITMGINSGKLKEDGDYITLASS